MRFIKTFLGGYYMPVHINDRKYYRTSEVCRLARISRSTLLRWLKEDSLHLQDYRDRRSWRLFTEEDVKSLVAEANRICRARSK
jgi:excisionase family DNA binding protein